MSAAALHDPDVELLYRGAQIELCHESRLVLRSDVSHDLLMDLTNRGVIFQITDERRAHDPSRIDRIAGVDHFDVRGIARTIDLRTEVEARSSGFCLRVLVT